MREVELVKSWLDLCTFRREILVKPDRSTGRNFSKPLDEVLKENAENSEDLAIEMDDEFFKGKLKNGFFIEARAFDGDCLTDVIVLIT